MHLATPHATPLGAHAPAERLQASILTRLERRTLLWLARRMPSSIHSDHLTVLALVAMLGAGASFWLARVTPVGLFLAIACLAVNWFGDSLDGTVARVRGQQRPRYGYYVDHVVDAVGVLSLLGGVALSGHMSASIAAGLLIAYFLLCLEVYLATHSLGTFRMSFFGVGPTELRILLSVGCLALVVHPHAEILGRSYKLFDVGGAVGICGLLGTFAFSVWRNTRALYQAEPMPARADR